MQDNWYETAISASAPHKIISVVDWASDASIPVPDPQISATYNVFTWGINDPNVGNRSINKENFDVLASPVGWHTLPYKNDPASSDVKTSEFYRKTATTWGNNVRDLIDSINSDENPFFSRHRSSHRRTGTVVTHSLTIIDRTPARARPLILNMILRKLIGRTPWTKQRAISTPQLPNSSTLRTWSMICTTGQLALPNLLSLHSIDRTLQIWL
jgi:hypothetical protein